MHEQAAVTRAAHDGSGAQLYTAHQDKMRYVFTHMTEFLPHSVLDRGVEPVRALPPADASLRSDVAAMTIETDLGQHAFADLVSHPGAMVDAVLVLKDGAVAYEAYPRIDERQRHIIWSVTKVFVSLAVGILTTRGRLDVERPIDAYVGQLSNSGWAGVSVRDVLDMASGINCLEAVPGAFDDPAHPYYRFEASLGYLDPAGLLPVSSYDHVATLKSRVAAGQRYEYTSVNTFVLGWLVEEVSTKTLSSFVAEEIWSRIGAERDAVWTMSPHGATGADGGLSMTLRDLGRFGLLFAEDSDRVLPNGHRQAIYDAGRPEVFLAGDGQAELPVFAGDPPRFQAWQWDRIWDDGDIYKGGWGGQGLHVSPAAGLVVAFFGTPDSAKFDSFDAGRLPHNRLSQAARRISRHLRS